MSTTVRLKMNDTHDWRCGTDVDMYERDIATALLTCFCPISAERSVGGQSTKLQLDVSLFYAGCNAAVLGRDHD